MKVGLGQINPTLGDFAGNAKKITNYIQMAVAQNCEFVVFPELALCGYPPMDLLDRPDVVKAQLKALKDVHKNIPPGVQVLLGAITLNSGKGKAYFNGAVLLKKGAKPKIFSKTLLPTYDVFDEARHFEPGDMRKNVVKIGKYRVLITICEDIWGWNSHNPIMRVPKKRVDLVLNISGSPFGKKHYAERIQTAQKTARYFKAPILYANMVGAQDELIFDGGSFFLSKKGSLISRAPFFEETLFTLALENPKKNISGLFVGGPLLRKALVLGIRDFVSKAGQKRVHVGLSGGIDSALVCALACEAVGPEKVTAIALPGPYSSELSFTAAKKLVSNLGCELKTVSIMNAYETISKTLAEDMGIKDFGLVHENLQARLRGLYLMAHANQTGSLLLSTGNKSEFAAGYCTLYGDMCGGLAVLGDLVKREVYEISKTFEGIPNEIIERAPSAELKPNQKDQDTLPPYDDLDAAVENLVERGGTPKNSTEIWLLSRLMNSEFKRWQAPPILRVSSHAFGRGRRYPIAHKSLF